MAREGKAKKTRLRLARGMTLKRRVHALCILLHCSIVFKALACMYGGRLYIHHLRFSREPVQRVGGQGAFC